MLAGGSVLYTRQPRATCPQQLRLHTEIYWPQEKPFGELYVDAVSEPRAASAPRLYISTAQLQCNGPQDKL